MPMPRRSFLHLAGCLGAIPLGIVPGSPAPLRPKPLTLQLDWVFNVQFAGPLLAHHQGLYAQRGVAVTLRPWEPGLGVIDAVVQHPLTLGCAEQNMILAAQGQGAPIRAIATQFQASPLALMSMPDRPVQRLTDLVGQTVGVHEDGLGVMALVQGINGLARDAIRVVEIAPADKVERLMAGEFAAVQCYAVDEPLAVAQRWGVNPILLPLYEWGYDAYAQVLFTTETLLATQRDSLTAFLAATVAGWQAALADIPGTAGLIATTYAAPGSTYTDADYQRRSLERVADYVTQGIQPTQLGQIRGDRWQATARQMAEYGLIARAPAVERSLDLSLWQDRSESSLSARSGP